MANERILLVEGEDDEHVVRHLYKKACGIEPNFRIVNQRGYEKLLEALGVHLKQSGLQTLGVVVDADDDREARWQELAASAKKCAVSLPDVPDASGTMVEGPPRVGIWLMPDNLRAGELEDFARELIPSEDTVWPLAKRYIAGIPEHDRKFKPGKLSRANLYAWIASREQPQRIGAAIGAGDLDIEARLGRRFVQWLRTLFED